MDDGSSSLYRSDRKLFGPRRPLSGEGYTKLHPGVSDHPSNGRSFSRRRRRRRGEHGPLTVAINRAVWLALLSLALLYVGFLWYARKSGIFTAKPRDAAEAPTQAPAERKGAGEQATGESMPLFAQIQAWKEGSTAVREGFSLIQAGRLAEAEDRLQKALAQAGEMMEVRAAYAHLLEQKKDYAAAAREWREVLARDPDRLSARIRLAGALSAAGRYEEALEAARWALEADSFAKEALEIAATSLLAMNRPREAIDYLRRLATIDRDDPAVKTRLGLAFLEAGDFRQAANALREAIRMDPSHSIAYFHLAGLHVRTGAVTEAVSLLQEAAGRFGLPFVLAWTRSPEFDGARETPEFKAFLESRAAAQNGVESGP